MIIVSVNGIASVFATPGYASVSDGSNYHIVTVLLNGQSGLCPGSIDTRVTELVAYKSYFLGQVAVAKGDVIALSTTKTGSPSPVFAPGSFALAVELAPKTPTR